MPSSDTVDELLKQIDESKEIVSESQVLTKLLSLDIEKMEREARVRLERERVVFSLTPAYRADNGWGTYYGPMWTYKSDRGDWMENPSVALITRDMLEYWCRRSNEADHPLLRYRYSNAAWDLWSKVTHSKPDIRLAHKAIDSAVVFIADNHLVASYECQQILKRALELSLTIRDPDRSARARALIIAKDESAHLLELLGTWGFAFDEIIVRNNAKPTDEEVQRILTRLESALACGIERCNHGIASRAGVRLLKHYRTKQDSSECARIARQVSQCLVRCATDKDTPAHVREFLLHNAFEMLHAEACDEAEKVLVQLREAHNEAANAMVRHSVSHQVSQERLVAFHSAMSSGTFEECLLRYATDFVLRKDKCEQETRETAEKYVVSRLSGIQIYGYRNQPVAIVKPYSEDVPSHIIMNAARRIQERSFYQRHALIAIRAKHTPTAESTLSILSQSPVFELSSHGVLIDGLTALWDGKMRLAVHILLPQFEQALRCVVEGTGKPIYKRNRETGMLQLKNLNELLREECVKRLFSEDELFYFEVLFIDKCGLNMRNQILHGLVPSGADWGMYAALTFQCLLLMSNLRRAGDVSADTEK